MWLFSALLRSRCKRSVAGSNICRRGGRGAQERPHHFWGIFFFFIALPASRALICIGPYQTVISFAVKTYCVLFPICYVCVYLCVHVCVGGQRFDIYGSGAS